MYTVHTSLSISHEGVTLPVYRPWPPLHLLGLRVSAIIGSRSECCGNVQGGAGGMRHTE